MKIDPLTRDGSDILAGIQELWNFMIPQTGILNSDFHLYLTGIGSAVEGEDDVFLEHWGINFDIFSWRDPLVLAHGGMALLRRRSYGLCCLQTQSDGGEGDWEGCSIHTRWSSPANVIGMHECKLSRG